MRIDGICYHADLSEGGEVATLPAVCHARPMAEEYPMRINKYLAMKGLSTRKEADVLIAKGLVLINGKKAVLGQKVSEVDIVEVRGKKRTYRYIAFNKPHGVVTHTPQYGEKSALESANLSGVFPVGRLDKRSSGLLILTDDARVTDRLLNPKFVHEKEYQVSAKADLPTRFKDRMERGVNIEGYMTKQCKVTILSDRSFRMTLTEGKKHQIRRMCAALGVDIAHLERIRIMNIKLAGLKVGENRKLSGEELVQFLKALRLT